jgi:regulation of enolase protein 1 (concanavalin A-like superfamily)
VAIIQNYNHRPVAKPDHASMIEGRSVKITPLSNDFDKDKEDELVLLHVSTPIHGKVEQKGNLLNYKPDKGFIGTDSFTYTISDGRKESKSASITIQVNKNLNPLANRDMAEVYCEGSTIIDVLKNDNDREGDSIFIKGYSQPLHGRLHIVENKLLYSSNASSACTDSFLYVINDGKSNSDSAAVIINVTGKSNPCYPWLSCDVGDAAKPGSFSCVNKTIVIKASGSDIWNNIDGFRYAYQYVTGDCEMYTKVETLEGTNEWAKAGIMVRESLSGGSKTAFVCITTKNGVTCHQRLTANESMEGGNRTPDIKSPYWVKLTRKGNTFNCYISANGNKWETLGTKEVHMTRNIYIGFAVTSHNNNEICKAVFSNYKLTGKMAKFQDAN